MGSDREPKRHVFAKTQLVIAPSERQQRATKKKQFENASEDDHLTSGLTIANVKKRRVQNKIASSVVRFCAMSQRRRTISDGRFPKRGAFREEFGAVCSQSGQRKPTRKDARELRCLLFLSYKRRAMSRFCARATVTMIAKKGRTQKRQKILLHIEPTDIFSLLKRRRLRLLARFG